MTHPLHLRKNGQKAELKSWRPPGAHPTSWGGSFFPLQRQWMMMGKRWQKWQAALVSQRGEGTKGQAVHSETEREARAGPAPPTLARAPQVFGGGSGHQGGGCRGERVRGVGKDGGSAPDWTPKNHREAGEGEASAPSTLRPRWVREPAGEERLTILPQYPQC